MQGVVAVDDLVYKYVVQQFNSRELLDRISWDGSEPKGGRPAQFVPAHLVQPTYIRITRSKKISGRDKWLMLVFELHNSENEKSFEDLYKKALAGEIDRDHYASACLALEFEAVVRTQKVFRRHMIHGSNATRDPYYWGCVNGSSDFEDYKKQLDSDDENAYDPRGYFGEEFDSVTQASIAS